MFHGSFYCVSRVFERSSKGIPGKGEIFMLRRSYEASRTRSVGLSVGRSFGRSSKQSLVHSKKMNCMNGMNWTN